MSVSGAKIMVSGYVQGVGYRYFALDAAAALGVKGYVRNIAGGKVEVYAEGEKSLIEELIGKLRQGPFNSQVSDVDVTYVEAENKYADFSLAY